MSITRILRTPVSNLISRSKPGAALTAADLPEPIATVIRETVERTRLWLSEQSDVTAELIAHFEDGLAAGVSAEVLVRDFGDCRVAAKLIRRSKKRGRGVVWQTYKWTRRAIAALILLLVLAYAASLVRMYLGAVKLRHNYWEELAAPALALPDSERAWPLYREAMFALQGEPEDLRAVLRNRVNRDDPTPEQRAAVIAANQEALELILAATERPHIGTVYRPGSDWELDRWLAGLNVGHRVASSQHESATIADNPLIVTCIYHDITTLRYAQRLLAADARLAIDAGDGARFARDAAAIIRLANQMQDLPGIIGDLVQVGALAQAGQLVREALHERPATLPDETLVALAHRLATFRADEGWRLDLWAERATFNDVVQRVYTDDGAGNGHPSPEFLNIMLGLAHDSDQNVPSALLTAGMSPLIADRAAMLAKHAELMEMVVAEDALPLWERRGSGTDAALAALDYNSVAGWRYMLIRILMPSLDRASAMLEIARQDRDATLTVIALELYHRRHGAWPATLTELTPGLLPTVPRDRYDGGPLKYKLVDGAPLLYSVGSNRRDDGGRLADVPKPNAAARRWAPPTVAALPPDQRGDAAPDGDWILWPPVDDDE
jgi:hypothetical protein